MTLKNKFISAVLASTLAWLPTPVKAEDNKEESFFDDVACEARVDYLSKYVFRGFTYSEGDVVQGTLTLSKDNFSIIGFVNEDRTTHEVNEEDITFDYSQDLGERLKISGGYTYLYVPNPDYKNTQEFYIGASVKTVLNPSVKFVHDFDEGKGNYIEGSVSHEVKIRNLPILLSATLGYNDHYFREESGLSHLEMKASAPIPLTEKTTLTPLISHSKSLDKTDFKDETYAGIGLSYKF